MAKVMFSVHLSLKLKGKAFKDFQPSWSGLALGNNDSMTKE